MQAAGKRRPLNLHNIYLLETAPGIDIDDMASEYSKHSAVEYAEPDYIGEICSLPNDTYVDPNQDGTWSKGSWGQDYEDLWGLKRIDAELAWGVAYDGNSEEDDVTVAVIDTGLDYDHEDIADNTWVNLAEQNGQTGIDDDENGYVDDVRGWNFQQDNNDPGDLNGHGTHVAGIIGAAGNNAIGICGVTWNSQIMGLKAWASSEYAEAICYAADNGARVVNLSWRLTVHSSLIEDAIDYAYYGDGDSGGSCTIVVAAGNDSDDTSEYFPQCMKEVIVVASTGQDDQRVSSSNFGFKVDVAAPGDSILSLRATGTSKGSPINEDYTVLSGTSQAAPHVAGLAALILAIYPEYDHEQIRQLLRISSDDAGEAGWDMDTGYGRINAANALQASVTPCRSLIVLPKPNETIDGLVSIRGTADGENFSHYELFYKELHQHIWMQIGDTTYSPVDYNDLGLWDVNSIPDGQYLLRLVTEDSNGNEYEDRTLVSIERTYVSYPETDVILRLGDMIYITGSVRWPDFQNYYVEYERESDPNTWYSDGVNLTNGGSEEVIDSVIAEFNTDEILIAESGYYNIRVVVNGEVGASVRIYLDRTLKQGWPRTLPQGYQAYFMVQSGAADLDDDGKKEIITNCPAYSKPLMAMTSDGNSLPGWPVQVENSVYFGCPAIGDLDGDGTKEVAVVVSRSDGIYLYAFGADGSTKDGWPLKLYGDTILMNSVLLADIDLDDHLEILALTKSFDTAYVYSLEVFDHQGTSLPGQWPRHIGSSAAQPCYYNRLMAVGNMDADPELEILYPNALYNSGESVPWKTELHVFDPNGSELAGWPRVLDYYSHISSPAVGDLDNNGDNEVVIGTDNCLYVLDNGGNTLWTGPGTYFCGSPAVGDLNRDGFLEIVLNCPASHRTVVWDHQGTVLKLLSHNGLVDYYNNSFPLGSPVLGDIDGDMFADIVLNCKDKVVAWNMSGDVIAGFPKQISKSEFMTPLITDLDADGAADLVSVSNDYEDKARVTIYAWDLDSPYVPDHVEWPQFHCNSQRTGNYADRILRGDFDEDFDVDMMDLCRLAEHWLTTPTDLNWRPGLDISSPKDYIINMADFAVLAQHWLAGVE
ncbi:MAG: S8 family serine peptidase [Planctomycetota bacterium]|jgi:subtilisin family serine protease